MNRALALFFLLIVALSPLAAHAIGENATDFTLTDIKGNEFRLGDHLGKEVIVVSFWMTFCKPCLVEMPALQKIYEAHKDKGLLVVSVNADDPSGVARAKSIARQKKVTFPVLLDSETKVTSIYDTNTAFPYTVLIGKDKKIAYIKEGFSAGDDKVLEKKILELLGEHAE